MAALARKGMSHSPARAIGTPPAIFTVAAVTPNGNRFRVRFGFVREGWSDQSERRPPWHSVLRIWKQLAVSWGRIRGKFSAV
ncbi:hypothetical protein CDAR_376851 [Caerostris darwini]|uniref:Uncharacterized protein n=1 Tax=Caerostris darwini TaxID=1538125 RepID=A0AAV4SV91_9ARAC|nr:hypothetical protein CDAR_376851 [Caerostris darwini]